jgi:hypothetical protein
MIGKESRLQLITPCSPTGNIQIEIIAGDNNYEVAVTPLGKIPIPILSVELDDNKLYLNRKALQNESKNMFHTIEDTYIATATEKYIKYETK